MPPWRTALDAALAAHPDPGSRYFTLATARPDGRPSARTVVFRGFHGEAGLLCCVDARSGKLAGLRALPFAEACWYFAGTRQQFRLAGPVTVLTEGPVRDGVWDALSPAGRAMFAWPPPGEPRADQAAFAATPGPTPPATFAVLLLEPDAADVLDLRPTPHHRTRYRRDGAGGWEEGEVNP